MCPTLLQLLETVVKASAIISLAAKTSHNLNSTLSFPSTTVTFPVIKAWALIGNINNNNNNQLIKFGKNSSKMIEDNFSLEVIYKEYQKLLK